MGRRGRARRDHRRGRGAPAPDPGELDAAELARRVAVREEAGERRKEAIAEVAQEASVPKREVFDAVVAHKAGGPHNTGASHKAGPAHKKENS